MKKIIISTLIIGLSLGVNFVQAKPDKEKSLPPGLQKKMSRGGQLPPGWQKKLIVGSHLDYEIYTHGSIVVPVGERGEVVIEVEGRVIRLIEASKQIIEILK